MVRLERTDLGRFPTSVQDVLVRAVNHHGVEYRMLDGSHIRLYNGDRTVKPIKIAAVRPAPDTLRRLLKWLAVNVEGWEEEE